MRSFVEFPSFTFQVRRQGFSRHFEMRLPGHLKMGQLREVVAICTNCATYDPHCDVETYIGLVERDGRSASQTKVKITGSRQAVAQFSVNLERAIRARLPIEPRVVLYN